MKVWSAGDGQQQIRARRDPAKNFQDLIVWQKAHRFVLTAYKQSEAFPKHEIYGLTSQLRRAAVSIPANIAVVLSCPC